MQKIISPTFLIIFILSFLSPTVGSAIDTSTSARILDNFKAQQEEILFESSPIEMVDANKILEQEYAMNGLDSLKNRLQLMQWIYTEKKEAVSEVRVSLEKALSVLLESIRLTEKGIWDANIAIVEKQKKIQHSEVRGLPLDVSFYCQAVFYRSEVVFWERPPEIFSKNLYPAQTSSPGLFF